MSRVTTSRRVEPASDSLSLDELRELFEIGGVEPALGDALRYCRDRLEPKWVFEAALETIGKLSAEAPSGAGGRHANPRTRRAEEERHYKRWRIINELREAGLSLSSTVDAAQTALEAAGVWVTPRTIIRSYWRIEKARRAAAPDPTQSRSADMPHVGT